MPLVHTHIVNPRSLGGLGRGRFLLLLLLLLGLPLVHHYLLCQLPDRALQLLFLLASEFLAEGLGRGAGFVTGLMEM